VLPNTVGPVLPWLLIDPVGQVKPVLPSRPVGPVKPVRIAIERPRK